MNARAKLKAFIHTHMQPECHACLHRPTSTADEPCVSCGDEHDCWEPNTLDLEAFIYEYARRHCSTCKLRDLHSEEAPCQTCIGTEAKTNWEFYI